MTRGFKTWGVCLSIFWKSLKSSVTEREQGMMRKTTVISIVLIICLALTACAAGHSNDVSHSQVSDDTTEKSVVCVPWPEKESADTENVAKSMTIEFDNKSYTGEYWRSNIVFLSGKQIDKYKFGNKGVFAVAHADGRLTDIEFLGRIRAGQKSIEDCKDEAVRIAAQYIDVDQYKLTTKTEGELHSFRFQRYIGDMKTVSQVSVLISTYGDLVQFSQMMTEEVENLTNRRDIGEIIKTIGILNSDKGIGLVDEKIRSMYESKDNLNYVINDKVMVVLDDEDIGVVVVADVSWFEYPDKLDGARESFLLREAKE